MHTYTQQLKDSYSAHIIETADKINVSIYHCGGFTPVSVATYQGKYRFVQAGDFMDSFIYSLGAIVL
jgi:hypothetical protein